VNKISALIPYKPDHGRRDLIWSLVRRRYEQLMPQVELCLGSDDHELFCRAKAINAAARRATGDILMLVDIDLVFETELLDRVLATIHSEPWVIPFTNAYRLTRQATDRWLENGLPETITFDRREIESDQVFNGAYLNVMTRSCFETVGGLDERFIGYGFEDMALAFSLDTLCGTHYRTVGNIYHLWHPWAEILHPHYQDNLALYRRYTEAAGDAAQMRTLIKERH
jgi:predicted glycosyltransferase involved in capsule biosynthesis